MRRIRVRKVRRPAAHITIGLASALVVGACSQHAGTNPASAASSEAIKQPQVKGLEVAPESSRVDLNMPSFSDPTNVTNPLFPVSMQRSVLMLGHVDGKAFRTEVTLLPDPRIIEWNGQHVPTLVSQYVAFLDGRIHEVAYDFYAQADDGSVWYFGEDVYNFKDGVIADTHGTWIAGKDGPAAMIMPADPQVGDVYRPENIPGFVFEEVTVKSVGQTLEGPLHDIPGGLVIEELHMDGATEGKTFAPGYGEFFTSGGRDVEALALAVPTDAASHPLPAELSQLESNWTEVFDAAGSKDWRKASAAVDKMTVAWEAYRTSGVPQRVEPRMSRALGTLAHAVGAHNTMEARQSAIDAAQSIFDLQLRFRPTVEVDLHRFDLWLAQLVVDAAREDMNAVNADFFTLDYIRDRILHSLDAAAAMRLNTQLEELLGAVGEDKLRAATKVTTQIRDTLAGSVP